MSKSFANTMQSESYVLHHYWRSSCSWRIRWAFEIKEIALKFKPIDLLKSEQTSPAYLKLNPSGCVPTLMTTHGPMSESLSILEWLEQKHPSPSIMPTSFLEQQKARQLALTIISGTQPLQNLAAQKYFSNDQSKRKSYAKYWITAGLKSYEQQLVTQSLAGTYSVGSQITIADLALIPQVYNAERFDVDLSPFPTINRICKKALSTQACIKSHPNAHNPN